MWAVATPSEQLLQLPDTQIGSTDRFEQAKSLRRWICRDPIVSGSDGPPQLQVKTVDEYWRS